MWMWVYRIIRRQSWFQGTMVKTFQLTKFRPTSPDPTIYPPPMLEFPLKHLIYCLSSLGSGHLPQGPRPLWTDLRCHWIRGEGVLDNQIT